MKSMFLSNVIKIVGCLVIFNFLSSCSGQSDEPDVPRPYPSCDEEYFEGYKNTIDALNEQIDNGTILDGNSLIEAAGQFKNIEKKEEEDGIVTLYFKGGWTFSVDFKGNTVVPDFKESDFDYSELDEFDSELSELLQSEVSSTAKPVGETRSTGKEAYLPSTMKILYWAPFDRDNRIVNVINTCCRRITSGGDAVIDFDSKIGKSCSINDLSGFGNYDIVIFAAHGDKMGRPAVPYDLDGLTDVKDLLNESRVLNGEMDVKCKVLDFDFLNRKLPSLDKTVMWTLMCYSFCKNSSLATVIRAKEAGDYFGATAPVNCNVSLSEFYKFTRLLYMGASSFDAFLPGREGKSYSFAYNGETVNGVFGHSSQFKGICFPYTYVKKAEGNLPVACWQAPKGELEKVVRGNGSFKAGIEIKNRNTSETTKIELLDKNIDSKIKIAYKDIIEGYKYAFKLPELKDGQYEYRSYVEFPNGRILYSNECQQLNISLLVGKWIFDKQTYNILSMPKDTDMEDISYRVSGYIKFEENSSFFAYSVFEEDCSGTYNGWYTISGNKLQIHYTSDGISYTERCDIIKLDNKELIYDFDETSEDGWHITGREHYHRE